MTDRFECIRKILPEALELEGARLAEFLDQKCGDDLGLRRDIEELLAERDALPTALRTGGSRDLDREPHAEAPDSIGPYRIISRLGEGGMGTVYLAEQNEPIRRRVALKLIKPGLDTRRVIARFEAERQTLALLGHPGIAQVHDAGSTALGRPYFVMEFVPGIAITEYCDDHRLAIRERLRLFVLVCRAIHHAHQRGVIHRDIKPSNLLVSAQSGEPVPKVIDFGIAKATDGRSGEDIAFTVPGQIIGTPQYMSPEQADPDVRDIDTTSDVYSLGVVLYELLTGVTPFDPETLRGAGVDELRRRIRDSVPTRPSQRMSTRGADAAAIARRRAMGASALARKLRGELDWITMCSMEKDRSRRYASASELGEDVERYLSGQPVAAGPPSASYRFSRLVRRNRTIFAAIACVFLVMAIGLGISTTLYLRAEAAREEAAVQARKAERVNEFLQSVLESADPEVEGPEFTVLELLGGAAARIDEELAGDPAVRASAHRSLGNTYDGLGRYDEAVDHLSMALEIHREILPASHPEVGGNLNDLGIALNHAGDFEAAEDAFREGLDVLQSSATTDDLEVGAIRINLAVLLKDLGRYSEAEPLYRETLTMERRVLGEDATVAGHLSNLAVLLRVQGKHEEAIETYREALAMNRKVAGDEHHTTATITANLAAALVAAGRYGEAEPLFQAVIELDRRTFGDDHPHVASDLNNLGSLYRRMGDLPRAEETVLAALDIRRRVLGSEHPSVAKSLMILGAVRLDTGHPEEAEVVFREALEIRQAVLPPGHPDMAWAQVRLGESLDLLGRAEEAERLLLRGWDAMRESGNVTDGRKRDTLDRIVALYDGWRPGRAAPYRVQREALARAAVED